MLWLARLTLYPVSLGQTHGEYPRGCYVYCFTMYDFPFSGAGADKLLKFKKWFWSIVEKMTIADRQDLVRVLSIIAFRFFIFLIDYL